MRPAERQRAPTKKKCKLTTPQTFSKPMRKARVPGCNFCETASKAKKWKHCQKMPNSACGKATSCIWYLATGAQTSLTVMAASGCLLQNWLETLCRMHPTENFRKLISLWKPSFFRRILVMVKITTWRWKLGGGNCRPGPVSSSSDESTIMGRLLLQNCQL